MMNVTNYALLYQKMDGLLLQLKWVAGGKLKMDKKRNDTFAKMTLIGHFCLIVASAGYYGYYLPYPDAFIWHWLIILAFGAILLGYKNLIYVKHTHDKRVFWELPFLFLIFLFPRIPLPYGLSTLFMVILSAILSFIMVQRIFKLWPSKKQNH